MTLAIELATETDTTALGRALGRILGPGDVVLLEGPIGAGKSHLSRALIRSRLGEATEVPSPTFTLVQSYEGAPDIWHADLYRLTHPDEVLELGLEDAFQTAICLIEWPDRLGKALPDNPLRLRLSVSGEGRLAEIDPGNRPDFARHLREALAQEFLTRAGWSASSAQPLAGDASTRSYRRLHLGKDSAILMDAPKGQPDRVEDFTRIARHLRCLGLSAPDILAEDVTFGFLLTEDLGDALYPAVIARTPALQPQLYEAAADVLTHLQAHEAPAGLPDLSAEDWAEATGLVHDFYQRGILGHTDGAQDLTAALTEALKAHADGPRVLILRDYHAENLIWLPDRAGLARVGLLDFQLGQMGQPGYDLMSLCQDARRDVPPEIEAHLITRAGLDPAACATLGAQRALRILGIFAKLALHGGKTRYLAMIPRVWRQLQRNLSHPQLADLRKSCRLPEPDAAALSRLEAQCGAFR